MTQRLTFCSVVYVGQCHTFHGPLILPYILKVVVMT